MSFAELSLRPEIVSALESHGYTTPTDVQARVIPLAAGGKHIVVQSQTGSGKTAAFVIPALNKIDTELRKPQILILEPTRELAMQTREEVVDLSKGLHMKSAVLYGGSWIRKQREELDAGPQIIIATPGRLIDLIERGWIDLRYIDTLIIDEVDQMMDMGFIEPVRHIWSKLRAFKQLMTFSATYSDTIMSLIRENIGTEYEMLQLQKTLTVDTIDHAFIRVSPIDKYLTAKRLISDTGAGKVIIFTKMKHETEEIARYLQRDGIEAGYLHGDLEQRDRIRTLKDYKDGHIRVFIATDIAARGLNLNNIDLVINYHVPLDPESYIHRIGRTGRAGASGKAVMLVSPDESRALMRVERTNKIKIKEVDHDGKEIERAPEYGGRSGGRSGGGGYKGGRSGGGGYRGNSGGGRSTWPRDTYVERPRTYTPRPDSTYTPRDSGRDGGRDSGRGTGENRNPYGYSTDRAPRTEGSGGYAERPRTYAPRAESTYDRADTGRPAPRGEYVGRTDRPRYEWNDRPAYTGGGHSPRYEGKSTYTPRADAPSGRTYPPRDGGDVPYRGKNEWGYKPRERSSDENFMAE